MAEGRRRVTTPFGLAQVAVRVVQADAEPPTPPSLTNSFSAPAGFSLTGSCTSAQSRAQPEASGSGLPCRKPGTRRCG